MKFTALYTKKQHTHRYNNKNIAILYIVFTFMLSVSLFSCRKSQEVSREEAFNLQNEYASRILEKTITKPGPPQYSVGNYGGEYHSTITSDIKSFNMVVIFNAITSSSVQNFFPYLFKYDPYNKQFIPHFAKDFIVEYDKENDISYVQVTLRNDIYWTTIQEKKSKLTSKDIIFWYNEVAGDERLQMSTYPGQFIALADDSKKRITIEKIDDYNFRFIISSVVANPLLIVNMNFGPKYI